VAQAGAFTGVAIDTFRGLFLMLPDKLLTSQEAVRSLRAERVSTPRLVSRVRGKILHYGSAAVPFLEVAAPSLSQLMHGRESGLGPAAVPTLREEDSSDFDWEQRIRVSERARSALDFAARALQDYGASGKPIWPLVPSSL